MQIDKTKPYSHTITFSGGKFKADEINAAMFLAFSPFNKDSDEYIKVRNALPRIKGLKSVRTRSKFAFELVNKLNT